MSSDARATFPSMCTAWAPVLLFAAASACGVRSDPFDLPGTAGGGGGGGGASCEDAEELVPLEDTVLEGTLPAGRGMLEGWCGRDGGTEDVYVLHSMNNRDILVAVEAVDDEGFVPTVRIEVDTCGTTDAVTDEGYTELCRADGSAFVAFAHVEAGHDYTIVVDSPEGEGGAYRVVVSYQRPDPDNCILHPESPTLVQGGYFLWSNGLGGGQGNIQGLCGGPGTENMFAVRVLEPGVLRARVTSNTADAPPIVDIRRTCAVVATDRCEVGSPGGVAEAFVEVSEPRTYYVTADHHGVGPFSYDLEVWLE